MKRSLVWGVGLILAGVVLWWGFQGTGQADHRASQAGTGYNAANTGFADDNVADAQPSVPGRDRDRDRTADRPAGDLNSDSPARDRADNSDNTPSRTSDSSPDRAPSRDRDRGGSPADQQDVDRDRDPDCNDGPGDDNCGKSQFTGDSLRDNPRKLADQISDDAPDESVAAGFNRIGEHASDSTPDRTNRDTYLIFRGLADTRFDRSDDGVRDCAAADVAAGECDDDFDDGPAVGGAGGGGSNPTDGIGERDRPLTVRDRDGADNTPDGTRDRRANFDETPDQVGPRGCNDAGECDRVSTGGEDNATRPGRDHTSDKAAGDAVPDAVRDRGAARDRRASSDGTVDGTPDRTVFANQDNRPDGHQDRANHRDQGDKDHNIASRDAFSHGPGDNVNDDWSDRGGLGYAAGGGGDGGGGCSLVASRTATTGSSLAYLLVLLAPVAFVIARRRLGRR